MEEYLKEDPRQGSVVITTGKISRISDEKLKIYEKLMTDGYLNVEYKEEVGSGYWKTTEKYYKVSLTEKAQDYVLETHKSIYPSESKTEYKMRTYTLSLDEVSDIFIRKEEKMATAKAKFKKNDKTPFYILEDDLTEFMVQEVVFYKTEDKGWRLMSKRKGY